MTARSLSPYVEVMASSGYKKLALTRSADIFCGDVVEIEGLIHARMFSRVQRQRRVSI